MLIQFLKTLKDDKFSEAMGAFCVEAKAECDIITGMFKNLESLYSELEKFYVFDKQKYNLEEFMSDIKTFIKQFKDAAKLLRRVTVSHLASHHLDKLVKVDGA